MLSKVILESNIVQSVKLLDNADNILITSHISPDGDAIGSSLGLFHMLKNLGKSVKVMVPNRYPSFFNWMPGIENVIVMEENKAESVKIFKESDLIFCLDYNSFDRVNGMKPLLETSKSKIIPFTLSKFTSIFLHLILYSMIISYFCNICNIFLKLNIDFYLKKCYNKQNLHNS